MEEITPKNDVMFKMIFGNSKHPRVLIHFLNCAIESPSPIESIEIMKNELTPEFLSQKGSRMDVIAKTKDGHIINIEIQRKDEKDMAARALFYWSKLFSAQLEVGENYNKLKRTISINILDFNLFEDDRYWRKGHLRDIDNNEPFTDLLEMQFVELNKMRQVDEKSPITFWIEFFNDPYSEKVKSLCEYVPEIREAKDIFEKAKSDPEAREMLRVREKAIRDYTSGMENAWEDGIEKGREEGREQGIVEGKEEEKRKAIANALKLGLSKEQAAEIVGISLQELDKYLSDKNSIH